MEKGEFERNIGAAWRFLFDDVGLCEAVTVPASLKPSERFNRIALNPRSRYRDIYCEALRSAYYNLILHDQAVFQFGWQSRERWRLAYLPNPWITGVEDAAERIDEWERLLTEGALDEEGISYLLDELPYECAVPPIRFEYARADYREIAHPAAHFHIGRHSENRWPVARLLGPLSFAMFVVKAYYPSYWCEFSSFHRHDVEVCLDERLISTLREAEFVDMFTERERRSLFFTAG